MQIVQAKEDVQKALLVEELLLLEFDMVFVELARVANRKGW